MKRKREPSPLESIHLHFIAIATIITTTMVTLTHAISNSAVSLPVGVMVVVYAVSEVVVIVVSKGDIITKTVLQWAVLGH